MIYPSKSAALGDIHLIIIQFHFIGCISIGVTFYLPADNYDAKLTMLLKNDSILVGAGLVNWLRSTVAGIATRAIDRLAPAQ
jgi:hypothetical protein